MVIGAMADGSCVWREASVAYTDSFQSASEFLNEHRRIEELEATVAELAARLKEQA